MRNTFSDGALNPFLPTAYTFLKSTYTAYCPRTPSWIQQAKGNLKQVLTENSPTNVISQDDFSVQKEEQRQDTLVSELHSTLPVFFILQCLINFVPGFKWVPSGKFSSTNTALSVGTMAWKGWLGLLGLERGNKQKKKSPKLKFSCWLMLIWLLNGRDELKKQTVQVLHCTVINSKGEGNAEQLPAKAAV